MASNMLRTGEGCLADGALVISSHGMGVCGVEDGVGELVLVLLE